MLEQHLEKLRSFYVTAQEKSLVKASHVLHVTQPAVGKNIKALENILNTTLFIRHRRGVEMTTSGEELFNFCESLFLKVKDVEVRLHTKKELSGVIRIGTFETLGESFWPTALKRIQKKYPDLLIELVTQGNIWDRLAIGAIDMIVDVEPQTTDQFHSTTLYQDQFGLFCRARSQTYEQELLPLSFVRHATDKNSETIEMHLRRLKLPFSLHYDVSSFTMVRALVKADLCIGVLPLTLGESSGLEPFTWKGNIPRFGEHRICATVHESLKSELRLKEVIKLLKENHP